MRYTTLSFVMATTLFLSGCGGSDTNTKNKNPSVSTPLQKALKSGDVSQVSETTLLSATQKEIQSFKEANPLLKLLYSNNPITYDPTNSSQFINYSGDKKKMYPILIGKDGHILALAGEKNNTRVALFGSIPMYFFQRDKNLDYQVPMSNLIQWLIYGKILKNSQTKKTIALSFIDAKQDTQAWLKKTFPTYTLKECNEITTHIQCIAQSDLIIEGSNAKNKNAKIIKNDIQQALKQHIPFLYLHPNWGENNTAKNIAQLFSFTMPYGGNWWAKSQASWSNYRTMQQALFTKMGYAPMLTMLQHFQNKDFAFDWSQCKDAKGNYDENSSNCIEVPKLKNDFLMGAKSVKKILNALDTDNKDIFQTSDYKLEKLLALLGDKYRQNITYPMDKVQTNDTKFMQSYYSDFSVYNTRMLNPAQKDMGNFSRSDFSNITPHKKTIQLISKKYFEATGVYALPGRTLSITRNDDANVTCKVFINTLRAGATHEYEKNGYKRPKYLQSIHFLIKPHETLHITSPYGGIVEISFNKNKYNTSFTFKGIGEHPIWRSSADDNSFNTKMAKGDFDWAEIVTSGFEVHSTLDKMRESIQNPRWGDAQTLANATKIYMSDYPHILAGFQGKGIDIVDEIVNFASDHNITMAILDTKKHMNADQATCGYGCSGNPYDAYWAFSPIGHGDLHELGHGLENHQFLFEGFELHAITNPYSYYSKSRYNQNTGGDPECQKLPFKEVFEKIQASVNENNATKYLKDNLWATANWSQEVLVTIEAMMHTQKMGKLQNGWHLLARLHILQRAISWAKKDWQNRKANIGFDSYTLKEFSNIRNNDWLLISYSFASELDFRPYFDMMGMEYSKKASQQVDAFHFIQVEQNYFISTPDGFCKTDKYGSYLDKSTLPIDGKTQWNN